MDTAVGTAEASSLQPPPPAPQPKDEDGAKPLVRDTIPFLTRVRFLFNTLLMKSTVSLFLRLIRIAAVLRRNLKTLPTYTKTYPVRPSLSNRVFIPKSHQPGTIHPLLITIHGGGFVLCDPSIDDFFNRAMADDHGFVVVAINYRKAPRHPFPVPVHDCAEIARAVLADTDLPVDLSRKAALAGFSAGGNLALGIAQLPGIKERISAVVPVYPVVDFTGRFKGSFRSTPDGQEDRLKKMGPVFNWAYIPVGQDLTDPLLSVICAQGRVALPQRMFFVGAEYDYLCHEAEIMARSLAFGKFVAEKDKVGDLGEFWEKDGVRWRMVRDVVHGWTHVPVKGEEDRKKQEKLVKLNKEISDWLRQE